MICVGYVPGAVKGELLTQRTGIQAGLIPRIYDNEIIRKPISDQ